MKDRNDIQLKLLLFVFSVIAFIIGTPMKQIDEMNAFVPRENSNTIELKEALEIEPKTTRHVHINTNSLRLAA